MELKFDVGDNVYYIRNNKVSYAKVTQVRFIKNANTDGVMKTVLEYEVRDLNDGSINARDEKSLGCTQAELFAGVKMIGPEHESKEDLWLGYKLEEV